MSEPEVQRPGDKPLFDIIRLDENMVIDLEQALCLQINHYKQTEALHIHCRLKEENGCIAQMSSAGKTDCSEDLMFVHGQLGHLYRLLFDLRQARLSPVVPSEKEPVFVLNDYMDMLDEEAEEEEAPGGAPTIDNGEHPCP